MSKLGWDEVLSTAHLYKLGKSKRKEGGREGERKRERKEGGEEGERGRERGGKGKALAFNPIRPDTVLMAASHRTSWGGGGGGTHPARLYADKPCILINTDALVILWTIYFFFCIIPCLC